MRRRVPRSKACRARQRRIRDDDDSCVGAADVIPELRRYLLEYPNAPLPNADSFFFWEKVGFGLKPTIRVNHAMIARGRTTRGHEYGIVAIKQLYATHYFHTALDVSVCIDDGALDDPRLLFADNQRLAAGRADGVKGRSCERSCRQDPQFTGARARVYQADGRTVVTSPLTTDSEGDVRKYDSKKLPASQASPSVTTGLSGKRAATMLLPNAVLPRSPDRVAVAAGEPVGSETAARHGHRTRSGGPVRKK